ncbi:MAG: DUF481 domain-containing protein [Rubripirellula sp.]
MRSNFACVTSLYIIDATSRLGLTLTVLLVMSSAVTAQNSIPSWQTGSSNWDGSGYTSHPPAAPGTATSGGPDFSSASSSSSPAQSDPLPYTIPSVPGVKTNPYLNSDSSGSSNTANNGSGATYPNVNFSELNFADLDSGQFSSSSPRVALAPPETDKPTLAAPDTSNGEATETFQELPAPKLNPKPTAAKPKEVTEPEPVKDPAPVESPAPDSMMGEIIAAQEASVDPAPLQSEVVRWYQYPMQWMTGWDSNAEFGLDGSSGNADTLALQTGLELKRKTDNYTFGVDIDYRFANNKTATTEDNGRYNLDVDRLFENSPWSTFGKFGAEWDKFKAFDIRLNLNGGLGYHWIREEKTTLISRFGAGASKEIGAPDDDWVAEAVLGMEAERQINSRHKVKAKVDYFPAWEDFSDYRLVADASWEILLDDEDNFSLKLAATDRYDSTPQGAEANDIYYSLLLLYKF